MADVTLYTTLQEGLHCVRLPGRSNLCGLAKEPSFPGGIATSMELTQLLASSDFQTLDLRARLEVLSERSASEATAIGTYLTEVLHQLDDAESFLDDVQRHFAEPSHWLGLRLAFQVRRLYLAWAREEPGPIEETLQLLRSRLHKPYPGWPARAQHLVLGLQLLPRRSELLGEEYFTYLRELVQGGYSWVQLAEKLAPSLQYLSSRESQQNYLRQLAKELPRRHPFRLMLEQTDRRAWKLPAELLSSQPAALLSLALTAAAWTMRRGEEARADRCYELLLEKFGENLPEWLLLRLAQGRYLRNDYAAAQQLLQPLARRNRQASELAAICLFYLGRYSEALVHQEKHPGLVEIGLRAREQNGEPVTLPEDEQDLEIAYYREALRCDAREIESKRAAEQLSACQLEEISEKLKRTDLVCHGLYSLNSLRSFRLNVFLVGAGIDGELVRESLRSAINFFERELGTACPVVTVREPIQLEELSEEWAEPRFWVTNVEGRCNALTPRRRSRSRDAALFFFPWPNSVYGAGVAIFSGHKGYVRMGHHRPYAATLVAHELGHALLQVDDLDDSRPLEDSFSIMGKEWHGPLPLTFLGLRYKAACLTPRSVQAHQRRGEKCRKRKDWGGACGYFLRAHQIDPWNLPCAFRLIKLLIRLKRRSQGRAVANQLMSRFPSLKVEIELIDLLGSRSGLRPPPPEEIVPVDSLRVAQYYLFLGRRPSAGPYLRAWREANPGESDGASLLSALAYAELSHWRLERAQQIFQKALLAAPWEVYCREGCAIVLCYQGRVTEAEREFSHCRALRDPHKKPAQHTYYSALFRCQWLRCRRSLRRILRWAPEAEGWQRTLGLVAWKLGDSQEAGEALREAWRWSGTQIDKAYLRWWQGRLGEAAGLARTGLRRAQTRPEALELLAHLEPEGGWERQLYSWLPHWPSILIDRPESRLFKG